MESLKGFQHNIPKIMTMRPQDEESKVKKGYIAKLQKQLWNRMRA